MNGSQLMLSGLNKSPITDEHPTIPEQSGQQVLSECVISDCSRYREIAGSATTSSEMVPNRSGKLPGRLVIFTTWQEWGRGPNLSF